MARDSARHGLAKLCLALVLLATTACARASHTARGSAGWSRGARVGTAATTDRPGMALSATGETLLLAWPARAETESIHLLALHLSSGETVAERDVPAPAGFARSSLLAPAGGDGYHLLWLQGPFEERALYHVLLSPDAAPAGEPTCLSAEGEQVARAAAAVLPGGSLAVLRFTQAGPSPFRLDLDLLHLDAEGQILSSATLLPNVLSAGVAADARGLLHLAWLEQVTTGGYALRYAVLLPGDVAPPDPRDVAAVSLNTTQSPRDVGGPVVTLAQGTATIAWTVTAQGEARLFFVTVEEGAEPQSAHLQASFPPACTPVEGLAALTCLASPLASRRGSAAVYRVSAAAPGWQGQALLALSVQGTTRNRDALQPGLVVVEGGRLLGHTVAAWTDRPSVGAVAVADAAGDVFLGWIDASGVPGEHPVYVSTTADAPGAALGRLTVADAAAGLADAAQRMVQGLVFVPLVGLWVLLPVAWLLATLSRGGDPRGRAAHRLLAVAVGLHWAGRYVLAGDLLFALPWLDRAPRALAPLLAYLAPPATMTLGLALARLLYVRRCAGEPSPLVAYLYAATADAVVSIALFGLAFTE